jgi:hypothetical protein
MANIVKYWKGAVAPKGTSPSDNEIQLWKGSVQPVVPRFVYHTSTQRRREMKTLLTI